MKETLPVKLKTVRRGSAFYFEKPQYRHYQDLWCRLYYVRRYKVYKIVTIEGHPDTKFIDGNTLVYRY